MIWSELISRRNVLSNIPMSLDGRTLEKGTVANIILMKVAYDRKYDEFQKFMLDVLNGLKKDGYDDRAREYANAEETLNRKKAYDSWSGEGEKPDCPTDEEIEKANDVVANSGDFKKEREELENSFVDAQEKKLKEEVKIQCAPLTKDDFAEICGVVGADGTIEVALPNSEKPVLVPRQALLGWVANLVE